MRALGLTLSLSLLVSSLSALPSGCGGSTAPMCQSTSDPQPAAEFCAPQRIAAGQALRLQLREQCGGCTRHAQRCEVAVSGTTVKLKLVGEVCTLPPTTACPAICSVTAFDCTVPALAAGTYQVSAEGSTAAAVAMIADPAISATACSVP